MKITILTKPPESFSNLFSFYLPHWIKNLLRRILSIPNYGPSAVLGSLIRGLDALGVDYQLNPRADNVSDIVGVISGVSTLRWAIEAKKKGKIKKIIAGPNIVITPKDAGDILLDEAVDLVIVPSQWVKDFYVSRINADNKRINADNKRKGAESERNNADNKRKKAEDKKFQRDFAWYPRESAFRNKIRVWAAGVEVCPESKEKREGCLIYKKSVDENLFNFVIKYLKSQNINYKIIKYGKYKKERYFEMLNKVKFMIYLSQSESQGLALEEAWIRDVPTLVWNRGYFEYKKTGKKFFGNVSAPYLTKECGMFFKNKGDFAEKLDFFVRNLSGFKPRDYSLKNFTDEISAKNYLKVIGS